MTKKKNLSFGEVVAKDWFSINPKSRTRKQLADYIDHTLPLLHMEYFGEDAPFFGSDGNGSEVPF